MGDEDKKGRKKKDSKKNELTYKLRWQKSQATRIRHEEPPLGFQRYWPNANAGGKPSTWVESNSDSEKVVTKKNGDSDSTEELEKTSAKKLKNPSTEELKKPTIKKREKPSTEELEKSSTEELKKPSIKKREKPSTEELEKSSTKKLEKSSTEELENTSTEDLEKPSTSNTVCSILRGALAYNAQNSATTSESSPGLLNMPVLSNIHETKKSCIIHRIDRDAVISGKRKQSFSDDSLTTQDEYTPDTSSSSPDYDGTIDGPSTSGLKKSGL